MEHYDVAIVGSGGGTKIARPAADLGFSVALVEQGPMGGTCLNRGCIPSKMLIHPADQLHHLQQLGRINIDLSGNAQLQFADLVSRVSQTVDGFSQKMGPSYDAHPRIDRYEGHARFTGTRRLQVNETTFTAERVFLATGSRPHLPELPGLRGTPFFSSKEALRNQVLPKTMIVIGAGFIACELGHVYSSAGTDTTFLVRSELLRHEDREIRAIFREQFLKQNRIVEGVTPVHVAYIDELFHVTVRDRRNAEQIITSESLLVANSSSRGFRISLGRPTMRIRLWEWRGRSIMA